MSAATYSPSRDFHNAAAAQALTILHRFPFTTQFTYTFETFFHPFVGDLIGNVNQGSVQTMLDPGFLSGLQRQYSNYYNTIATSSSNDDSVVVTMPNGVIDTTVGGPYSVYNWELFYHIPVMIAVHLSQNQRFAEAQAWFHLVFDPTFTDSSSNPSYPFWKFIGFRQPNLVENLVEILSYTGADPTQLALKQQVVQGYSQILTTPFDPHAVARTRPLAYMYYVVMKYLDNLIAWGDSLFGGGKPQSMQQPTVETINEATLCYVLAANLLGPAPQQLTPRGTARTQTYASLQALGMDPMGNALVDLEVQFPFNMTQPPAPSGGSQNQAGPLFGIGQTLYFCIPPNQTLLGYWDTVADRLFKIRNCENIAGAVVQLPLFDPPLDPGMLVQAAAAGIDIGSIVSGLNQPIGPVRSTVMLAKALELAGEVRSFGTALLAALEKGDAEHLANLRQTNEVALQQSLQNVRFLQWKQAQESTQSLLLSRATALERYTYYLSLLNATPNATDVPATFDTSNSPELTEKNFSDVYAALVGQYDLTITPQVYPSLQLAGTNSPSAQSGASSTGQLYLNKNEDTELNTLLPEARDTQTAASTALAVAGVLTFIPDLDVNLEYWGLGASTVVFSGAKLADAVKVAASVLQIAAGEAQSQAGLASRTATYQRRVNDWTLQANLAARELMQIGRQIIGSLIAEQVAYHDYTTLQLQVTQAQTVAAFMQNKFTNEELYLWMQGQLSNLFYQYYRFALDTSRAAEQTVKQELMRPELDATTFIQPNYWDSNNQGLLSGEALHLDLKRLELAYYTSNVRELEITRHVSLRQLNPQALIALRTTGTCTFTIPEWFFDRECPGQYMRRIKSVGLSLPSVVGAYTTVNCTVTQQSSSVRISSELQSNTYARQGTDDDRFVDYFGSSSLIVTSSASNDSGMFDTNLRDERFLPFEGSGVINSTWQLALPQAFQPFDYTTIPDAILHLRYTARDGGAQLAAQCTKELVAAFKAGTYQLDLLFLLRNDFPTEWAAFANSTAVPPAFTFTLQKSYFPYAVQNMKITLTSMALYSAGFAPASPPLDQSNLPTISTTLNASGSVGVTFSADTVALVQGASQVYLIVQYSAAA
jgi:hypothetical protein